ncbi:Transmembrane protein 181 [Galemys pyrenaicus]|uniref:Transmembrane protein 181 n=1 Tax=Galemys pyrenaicus TaxID=202257 RepID=A0A8J6DWI6_GALPY|nr:Transmembrane protein 181 [Galemys pyrenaicus]
MRRGWACQPPGPPTPACRVPVASDNKSLKKPPRAAGLLLDLSTRNHPELACALLAPQRGSLAPAIGFAAALDPPCSHWLSRAQEHHEKGATAGVATSCPAGLREAAPEERLALRMLAGPEPAGAGARESREEAHSRRCFRARDPPRSDEAATGAPASCSAAAVAAARCGAGELGARAAPGRGPGAAMEPAWPELPGACTPEVTRGPCCQAGPWFQHRRLRGARWREGPEAPCLMHSVCRLAPMRLYTLSKRHFVLVFVVFFVCFGLTVFIGIRGPKVIQTSAANFSLNNGKKLKPIQISSNPLSTYNQQLWLTCVVELEQSKGGRVTPHGPARSAVRVDAGAAGTRGHQTHHKTVWPVAPGPRPGGRCRDDVPGQNGAVLVPHAPARLSGVAEAALGWHVGHGSAAMWGPGSGEAAPTLSCASAETSIQTSFPMTVKVDGVSQDGTIMFIHNKVHNHTRTLTCAGKCSEIIVAHLGYLNYTKYTVIVGFEHLKLPIKEMNFTWKTYNPAFSQWEIWFRFIFVVLTFVVTCLFAHSLRKFSMRDWGIEQKWMSILLPLLLLYNAGLVLRPPEERDPGKAGGGVPALDCCFAGGCQQLLCSTACLHAALLLPPDPFFPLSFLVNSWFPGMLDDLFQSVFLCALLLFWLCVYHGIRVQVSLGSAGARQSQRVNELHDPMYQYRVDTGNFQVRRVGRLGNRSQRRFGRGQAAPWVERAHCRLEDGLHRELGPWRFPGRCCGSSLGSAGLLVPAVTSRNSASALVPGLWHGSCPGDGEARAGPAVLAWDALGLVSRAGADPEARE